MEPKNNPAPQDPWANLYAICQNLEALHQWLNGHSDTLCHLDPTSRTSMLEGVQQMRSWWEHTKAEYYPKQ